MPTLPDDLRVCVATDEFHPMGGTERQVVELAIELRRRAIPVTVLSRWPLREGNPYVRELQEERIEILSPGWTGRRGGRFRRLAYVNARIRARSSEDAAVEAQLWRWQEERIRRLKGDGFVLHEMPFFGVFSAAGLRTLNALRVPLVHTVLGRMEGVIPVVNIPEAVVTADGDPAVEPTGTPIRWIPSMGPRVLADHAPDFTRPESRIISFGGRLVPEKGVDVLLRAASQLPDVEVVVAGYGPERAQLEVLASELGVAANFTGPLDQSALHAMLGRSDVAVFPGLRGEGLPSFVVEALGAGVPVVGTDVGAVGRALGEEGGVLVQPGDPVAMAAAIDHLLATDLQARRHRARRLFERRFAPASVVDSYLDCYADVLRATARAQSSR